MLVLALFVVDGAPYTTQFHAILEVEDIEMKLCDHETNYTDIHVTGGWGLLCKLFL